LIISHFQFSTMDWSKATSYKKVTSFANVWVEVMFCL
jgi:hypothetical protein